MATWSEVKDFVHGSYRTDGEVAEGTGIKLLYQTGGLRTQAVFIWHTPLASGEEWLTVSSVVGKLGAADLIGCLKALDGLVCGGLSAVGDLLVLRHAVPMINMDINELSRPLELIVNSADELERRFVGGDQY